METILRWSEPPQPCQHGADHLSRREYMHVATLGTDEYMDYLQAGWRRFGHTVFRYRCSGPGACRSLRVDVARFQPDRSQRRTCKANQGAVRLRIGPPAVSREKLALFDRFHANRALTRGWPSNDPNDAEEYGRLFVSNPFPTQEWCYFIDDELVGIGYVDDLAGGLSAIYFAHDPIYRDRSPGTWNVLCLIEEARHRGLPHVYLGYTTDDCPSLRYKARFRPNQVLGLDGKWCDDRP